MNKCRVILLVKINSLESTLTKYWKLAIYPLFHSNLFRGRIRYSLGAPITNTWGAQYFSTLGANTLVL